MLVGISYIFYFLLFPNNFNMTEEGIKDQYVCNLFFILNVINQAVEEPSKIAARNDAVAKAV